jgi:type I restriction enzyme S subunit
MITDLKPYAEYKESGLPWLGQVPGHWVTKRGKSYLVSIDERSKTGREELLTVSSARGVVPRSSANVTMFKAESYAGHKLCWPGDLVINSLWAWAGGLGVSQHHGIISTAYSVYRSRPSAQINPRFLHELVRSSAFHWELQVRSKGVWISRLQLTDTAFLDAPIPLPPPDEQAAIVRFLDWASGRLERAIRAKRKVITLLNEQKQAIIHRAVTRGLDPSVSLKPSDIPWLGDIPQHWEARRLKHLARFESGDGITSLEIEATGPYPVYGGNGLRGYTTRYTHDGHYALIGRQGALCGNINFASGQFFASEHAVVPTLRSDMSIVWFGELLRVMNLNQYSQSAAQPGLAVERIKNLYAPVPPINEQKTIVESVERDTAPLAAAISRFAREIELLREYRTRLVTDVVTGKFDVREAATHLPDEAPLDVVEDDTDLSLDPEAADEEAAV